LKFLAQHPSSNVFINWRHHSSRITAIVIVILHGVHLLFYTNRK
jgi:hypothetical protein